GVPAAHDLGRARQRVGEVHRREEQEDDHQAVTEIRYCCDSSLPPPLWGRVGEGGGASHPPPPPSPTRGEGARRKQLTGEPGATPRSPRGRDRAEANRIGVRTPLPRKDRVPM